MTDRLPNFVIIGAPRSGTTSVHEWLLAHPEACAADRKETYYLLDAGDPHHRLRTANVHEHELDGYAALFARCAGQRVRFESSTQYLYAATARTVLATLPTAPRVLVLLREPAWRAYSAFRYIRDTRAEADAELSFRAYIDAVRAGDDAVLQRHTHLAADLQTLRRGIEYGRYATYIARWYEALGRDRVQVELFDHVMADPAAFMTGLAARLGIDPGFYDRFTFGRHNPTVRARVPWLHRWLRRAGALGILPGIGLIRRVYRPVFIDRAVRPSDEDLAALRDLAADYAQDNAALAALTGLDLAAWASPFGPARR